MQVTFVGPAVPESSPEPGALLSARAPAVVRARAATERSVGAPRIPSISSSAGRFADASIAPYRRQHGQDPCRTNNPP